MSHGRVLIELNWSKAEPTVRLRDDDERTSRHENLIGLELRFRLGEEAKRWCLGHRAFGGNGAVYIDCLKPPKPGSKKCVRCSIHDANFATNIHHAHTKSRDGLDPFVAKHLAKTNLLYLAGFRDGSIKIGTTTAHRKDHRLSEQGAWLAQVVAIAEDGFVVREIEDLITEFAKVPQAVSGRRKLAGLMNPVSDSALGLTIAETAKKVVGLVDRLADQRLVSTTDGWQFPGRENPAWKEPVEYPLPLSRGNHHVVVVDACGRMVALQRFRRDGTCDDEIFLADLGQLFGYELEMGEYDSDEISVQSSLF